MKIFTLVITFLCLSNCVCSQENKVINNFKLINAINNKEIALSDFKNKKAIAIVFTSNYCPYSKLYEDRIMQVHQKYAKDGLQVIMINPNDPDKSANDSIEKMAEKAYERQYPFPYLADKQQIVGKQFGATKTPEVFLLVQHQGGYRIVYSGAIDDNPQVPQDVNNNYFSDAISTVLNGETLVADSKRPTGCVIKNN